ncbi:exodeoxyribonuclease VII large subunit [Methylobacterium sp. PvP062]|uniref:Exodeoxyribonuclease 7 large subunit n=4 Tax=Methylobacterium radiotolerans TaxID=31998 RepID=B1LWH6_METRJ|nr:MULTISPECIES: exodeoxyribonuclease VII large subunit [Methylobacterium]MCX7330435.1 exodeoxyribonuclease VII large subunit [Hyphomicrobiales bacterium]ACB22678.1 exodeoxyribonuclease VII, large subunit [Methylobacterium radiotolerans JCM 2831]MBP2493136.1 exodeoxyribonuclease VII large subunit [Methylobacterium sp. PvP105]MBP2500491.1 exodeoxyribonuclease VII large subunit [Methylobacterium sp. PvP109]MDE3745585.1 exodeoxyribonuclease VII large subunit [Methylobacterium radiotolerans]
MPLVPPPRPAAQPAADIPPTSVLNANQPEWSVGELAGALKRTLEDAFGHVRLRGEISGYRGQHGSGHAYFSLKDGQARIDAVVWKGVFGRLRQRPQEGLEVVATGRITTFAGKSSYQIVIESLEPAGLGAWMALLEERKKQLAAEGLFAPDHKRPIPYLPRVVGVVTSPTGAVIRDILHRLEDRFPRPVLVWPVRVQGDGAAEEVAAAIRGFNALPAGGPIPRPDVLIVARGGGSIEDLWAFNEECVVRAAFASAIPLISAVGHETDTTLIDYVSDRRAPTPTGAAEMAVPVRADLIATVADLAARGRGAVGRRIDRDRSDLRALGRALPSADALLAAKRQRLDLAEARLAPALAAGASRHRARLQLLLDRMARRSPDVALANARARLARIDHRPLHALRNDVQRKGEALIQLGRRLVVAREASLERARALQARRTDRLLALSERLAQAGARGIERRRDRLDGLAGLLGSLSYRAVLDRGYVLVRDAAGLPVRRAAAAAAAQRLSLQFADGTVTAVPDGTDDPSLPVDPSRPAKPGRRGGAAAPAAPGKRTGTRPAATRQGSLFDA